MSKQTSMTANQTGAHTPGPWKSIPPTFDDGWSITDSTGRNLFIHGRPMAEQNAKLAASAPELLAALELGMKAIESLQAYSENDYTLGVLEFRDAAIAALAKAKGQP